MPLYKYYIFLIFILATSCTEKFFPEVDSETRILVVDGKITNKAGPYELKLFRTMDINISDSLVPETGAIVFLYDDQGNSDAYTEIEPGIYKTQSPTFKGEVGRSYWVEILTENGNKFESSPELINAPLSIDSIYGEETQILRNDASTYNAAKFYMDVTAPTNQNNYLRWEYKESYEWQTPFYEPKSENPSRICYPKENSDHVFVLDATKQYDKTIKHLETGSVSEFEVKLNHEYLLQITLYKISFKNYQFWQTIKQSKIGNDGLYGTIPANANGNICACNSNSMVIGYFEASGISQKKQFFNKDDFELDFETFPAECEEIHMRMEEGYPDTSIYHVVTYYVDNNAIVYVVRPNFCYDCNVKYSPNKPSFWP